MPNGGVPAALPDSVLEKDDFFSLYFRRRMELRRRYA